MILNNIIMDKKEFTKVIENAKIELFFASGKKKAFLANWLSLAEKQLNSAK